MTSELPSITFKAIGIVRNEVKHSPGAGYSWDKVVSEVEIDSILTEALDGLDEFSHIIVLYWSHQTAARGKPPTKVHPRRNRELPLTGLFATRSPHRPNSIGKATVRLLERQGNILRVKGLDAIDGTPVIDIKPYLPGYDSVPRAKVPKWTKIR